MKRVFLAMIVIGGTALPAAAESIRGGRCTLPMIGLAPATVVGLSAVPGTISFSASNPAAGSVAGSSSATLSWTATGGSHLQTWTVGVQAGASSFTGCSTVPVSAVTVTCISATVGGGAGTGSCNGAATLTTSSQQVAGGAEGDGTQSYSVNLTYTLAESWRYVANPSCSLTITYTVNAP